MAARLRGGRRTHSSEHKACPRGGSRTCAWSSMCRPSPPCTGNPPQHAGPSASRSRSTKTLATWRVVWRFPKRRLKRERRNLKKSEDPEWMQKKLHLHFKSSAAVLFFSGQRRGRARELVRRHSVGVGDAAGASELGTSSHALLPLACSHPRPRLCEQSCASAAQCGGSAPTAQLVHPAERRFEGG